MLYVGLDFSRKRLQWSAFDEGGSEVVRGVVVPEPDGLSDLVGCVGRQGRPVLAAIESMTGSRFVHDQLELRGWDVRIADAQRVKGLAPLACKTDRIDARVLAELAWRDLIPEIWLPDPAVRAERERALIRRWSRTVSPVRSATCSGSVAAGCWPSWSCQSRGRATSRSASP